MHVTPGAVSHQLRLIEQHFGVPLFVRHGRGVALTASGASYFERVCVHFEGLRQASSQLRGSVGRSVLRLRSYTTFATRWLIPRITRFQLAHPTIDIRLKTESEWSDLGDFDAAVRLGDGNWPQYRCCRLVPNILVPVCSPSLIQVSRPLDARWLVDQTILTLRARPDDWLLWCEAAGIGAWRLARTRELESSALAYQAAVEGHGVALAQRALVGGELATGSLIAPLPIELDLGDFTYYLVSARSGPKQKLLEQLCAFLISQAPKADPA
jgi:LysR family glycine cleavage system transcriptional activator